MTRQIWVLGFLIACTPPVNPETRVSSRKFELSTTVTPKLTIDPVSPWPRHVIAAPAGFRGADGVDLATVNGQLCVTSGWEQSMRVTVSCRSSDGSEPWPTVILGTNGTLGAVEDAVFADIDSDGVPDVIAASEGSRLNVYFGPTDLTKYLTASAWTPVQLPATWQRWMKSAAADMDGDGTLDIVAGGKQDNRPAMVGWWSSATPRVAASWVWHPIRPVAWTMSLYARDVDQDGDIDVVTSDREYIRYPALDYQYVGIHWIEHKEDGTWQDHLIGKTTGYHQTFFIITDWDGDGQDDIVDAAYKEAPPAGLVNVRRNLGSWQSWQATVLPIPSQPAWLQDVQTGDIDDDGQHDLVLSYALNVNGPFSTVLWEKLDGTRGEVSGPPGIKVDNAKIYDVTGDGKLDIIQSEQIELQQVLFYENPGVIMCPSVDAGPCSN